MAIGYNPRRAAVFGDGAALGPKLRPLRPLGAWVLVDRGEARRQRQAERHRPAHGLARGGDQADPAAADAQPDLGFGRIVVSEIEAPNMLVNLV